MADAERQEPESVRGEVVEMPQKGSAEPDHPLALSPIDAAIEGARNMPGVPGMDEFLSLAMTARILAMAGTAPALVRNDVYVAFHVALVGRDLDLSPSAALQLIDVIAGKNGGKQISLSPQLLNGQIRRLGLGQIVKVVSTTERCVAVGLGPRGVIDKECRVSWPNHVEGCECRDILGESEFTWEDARMANLVGRECQPGEHKRNSEGRCGCNQGYITYPKRMLWWRAAGFAADDIFPEASLGHYSAEALGAVIDADGRPIDPATIALPEGYEPEAPPPPETADPEALWRLQMDIEALPPEETTTLRERWKERLQGVPVRLLDARGLKLAEALVRGAQSQAKGRTKNAWQPDQALLEVAERVAQAAACCLAMPPGSPEAAPEPQGGPPAGEAPTEDGEPEAESSGRPVRPTLAPGQQEPAAANPAPQVGEEPSTEDLERVSEEAWAAIIATVKSMRAEEVDDELTRLRQHTEGKLDTRKKRLTVALLREQLATTEPQPEGAEE